jgi:hypothetical protein
VLVPLAHATLVSLVASFGLITLTLPPLWSLGREISRG